MEIAMKSVFSYVLLLIASGVAAVPVSFDGPVESVVVYTSGFAQVTRSAEVQFAAGETVLESKPLPPAADISSILVSIQGKQAAIQAVEMRRELSDIQEPDAKIREFLEEYRKQDDIVFGIQRELAAIDGRMQGRRETLAMLDKMREKSAQAADREMAVQKPDAEGWGKMISMAQVRADSARAEIRECITQRREAQQRFALAMKKLHDIRRKAPRGCDLPPVDQDRFFQSTYAGDNTTSIAAKQQTVTSYGTVERYFTAPAQTYQTRVFITVTAKAAVKARVTLKYNVSGANWTPTYRVNADITARTAQLDVQGEVSQSSGEDWNSVSLSLSTARPDLGTDVPVLMPWYIRAGNIRAELEEADIDQMQAAEEPIAPYYEPSSADESSSSGMATVFTAQTKTTIPSDNEAHRIPVTSLSSSIGVEHVAIPKILQHAFVQATLSNRASFALVPGIVEVMVGGNYLGRGMIKATAPGEEIKLSLGIDEQVKIRLKAIDDKGERKARGGRIQSNNAFEISAVSYKESDIRLTIIDQLPISADRRITVTYGAEAKKALRGAEYPGQLRWELALTPKKPQSIRFDFTVEYPEELRHQLQADDLEYNFNQFRAEQKPGSPAPSQQANWVNAPKKGKVRQSVKF